MKVDKSDRSFDCWCKPICQSIAVDHHRIHQSNCDLHSHQSTSSSNQHTIYQIIGRLPTPECVTDDLIVIRFFQEALIVIDRSLAAWKSVDLAELKGATAIYGLINISWLDSKKDYPRSIDWIYHHVQPTDSSWLTSRLIWSPRVERLVVHSLLLDQLSIISLQPSFYICQ